MLFLRRLLRSAVSTIAAVWLGVVAAPVSAQSFPGYVFSGPLLPLILQMPANSWLLANANLYNEVWTPPELEPLFDGSPAPPSKIIVPWSSFAWDSNRGRLMLWGGGHANYSGNDLYLWDATTLLWKRGSYPSEITTDPVIQQIAIDGVDNAPISSHTYDNQLFLPIVDRFITFGGAAYNNGGPFIRRLESNPSQSRLTGPYLFDPNRADGNKVGGTTGSHVKRVAPHPEIVGGQMWQNRDIHKWLAGQPLPGTHVNGCTGYANEGGRDVVYVASASRFSTPLNLYRYQLTSLASPAADEVDHVGIPWIGVSGQTTCGYDPARKLFVRTGTNSVPFVFWDVTAGSPTNQDQSVAVDSTIASFQAWMSSSGINIQNCGLEFDPMRATFPLWCGAATVWELRAPPGGNTTAGWTITRRDAPSPAPPGLIDTGVMGKWKYAPHYDVFVGLQDAVNGDVWIYKPAGWVQPNPPGNALPTVSVTSPAPGTTVSPGATVNLTASAADAGGSIVRVEYYVNGEKVGQATASPYAVAFEPILIGSYTVVAVAVDNVGGMRASVPVTFSVGGTVTTAVLQRGVGGYSGAADTYLDQFLPTTVRGASTPLYLTPSTFRPLVRFSIFASEGGPVPSGAVIQSATLALYKQYYDDTLTLNAVLKPWVEAEATWNIARNGVPWSAPGAGGVGTDYVGTADATASAGFNPGWVSFDVTTRVRQWADGIGTNYGWRILQATASNSEKLFESSESASASLRPKLTIVYSSGGGSAGCATFTDVAASSPFCADVEWVKNRQVTLGCAPNAYCPVLTARRDQMAAFMKRLGTAITPLRVAMEQSSGAATLGNGSVVCQTPETQIIGYPRRAYVDAIFMGIASTSTPFGADVVASVNGGAWTPLAAQRGRGTIAANHWANARSQGSLDLSVGQRVRFGLVLTRGVAAGTAQLTDSRCNLRASIGNRNPPTSPF
jgi:hypothetical protein